MAIKNPDKTPKSKIRAGLRRLWSTCRERSSALKRDNYTCQICGVKQSRAKGKEQKVCVHHKKHINWEKLIDTVYEELIHSPEDYITYCPNCHTKEHKKNQAT